MLKRIVDEEDNDDDSSDASAANVMEMMQKSMDAMKKHLALVEKKLRNEMKEELQSERDENLRIIGKEIQSVRCDTDASLGKLDKKIEHTNFTLNKSFSETGQIKKDISSLRDELEDTVRLTGDSLYDKLSSVNDAISTLKEDQSDFKQAMFNEISDLKRNKTVNPKDAGINGGEDDDDDIQEIEDEISKTFPWRKKTKSKQTQMKVNASAPKKTHFESTRSQQMNRRSGFSTFSGISDILRPPESYGYNQNKSDKNSGYNQNKSDRNSGVLNSSFPYVSRIPSNNTTRSGSNYVPRPSDLESAQDDIYNEVPAPPPNRRGDRSYPCVPPSPEEYPPKDWFTDYFPPPWNVAPYPGFEESTRSAKILSSKCEKFKGDLNHYPDWRNFVLFTIHSAPVTVATKLMAIKNLIDMSAPILRHIIPRSRWDAQNYASLIHNLESKYGGPRRMVLYHQKEVQGLQKIQEGSLESLEEFVCIIQKYVEVLEEQDLGHEANTISFYGSIFEKVPRTYQYEFTKHQRRLGHDPEAVNTFNLLDFLQVKVNDLRCIDEQMDFSFYDLNSKDWKKEKGKTFKNTQECKDYSTNSCNDSESKNCGHTFYDQASKKVGKFGKKLPFCHHCEQNHYLRDCDWFISAEPNVRKAYLREHDLCFACFHPHLVSDCTSVVTCDICGRKHHTLIHGAKDQNKMLSSDREAELLETQKKLLETQEKLLETQKKLEGTFSSDREAELAQTSKTTFGSITEPHGPFSSK